MIRWGIERSWTVVTAKGARERVKSTELREHRACALLGAAGLGKTFELEHLASLDKADGLDVRSERLASLGQTPESLENRLKHWAQGVTERTVFYLDALDEVMVPVRTAAFIIDRWIRESFATVKPFLRISCRSAVWPSLVESAIVNTYDEVSYCVAHLELLTNDDVRAVATQHGLDGEAFVAQVFKSGATVLSQQPLTLEMLLKIFAKHASLPSKRITLFDEGVRLLASERSERRDYGTAPAIPIDQLLEAAERLACFTLLSGRELIDLTDSPRETSLGLHELGGLPGGERRLDHDLLSAIGASGLCAGEGGQRFRFGHRQFAEYLAGRRIARLLLHQGRSLLASGIGWQAGVAGALRETAAFAAMESPDIAAWITDHDPEVVGLSDVADESLRRRATLNLLDKCRKREITDTQVSRKEIELSGLRYEGAEADLAPVLLERWDGCEDVLECAIELIESWQLSSMSDELAALALDKVAPFHPRVSAGYALAKFGTLEAKRRLLPLLSDSADDPDLELKGLALRCNWPESMSVPELLDALKPRADRSLHGAYDGFLYELDRTGFDARGHRLRGLEWAQDFMDRRRDYEPSVRIAKRVAIAAVDEIDEPGIAAGLAKLLLETAKAHEDSPLVPPRDYGSDDKTSPPPILASRTEARRKLIDAVCSIAEDDDHAWLVVHNTPSFIVPEDFEWLLNRATDTSLSMPQRAHYVEVARYLPWMESPSCVDAWLKVHDIEPISTHLSMPLSVTLGSDEAARARKHYNQVKRWNKPARKRKVKPPPKERVALALNACERKSPLHFFGLARELTLTEDSTHYGFCRFVVDSPGWAEAAEDDRSRIVNAAKAFLTSNNDEADAALTLPLNRLLSGHITATWLVMDQEPEWLESLPVDWWHRWSWYFLRELHPNMHGEPESGPKRKLIETLLQTVPDDVRQAVRTLATASEPEGVSLLKSLLGFIEDYDDPILDNALSDDLEAGKIPEDRARDVAQFVLSRNSDRGMQACLARLETSAAAASESIAVRAAVALLHERASEACRQVVEFLKRRPNLAVRVLGEYSHSARFKSRDDDEPDTRTLDASRIGELYELLLEHFPPGTDPDYGGEAHSVGEDDSARHLRDQLISWLGDQRDLAAVETLRGIEKRWGKKYPWHRRPRARAERSYRIAAATSLDPRSIAELLAAREKRLIRSGQDALDGIIAAIEEYNLSLRSQSPSNLDDLWNRPRGRRPTPKEEERFSDKICVAVRDYFRDFAVTADREVQIARRTVSVAAGGSPGSEVDVLYRIAATGTGLGDPIAVPIEVKLSHNPEARTGLKEQLVSRYMKELGTDLGVYVIAWVGTDRSAGYKALWPSINELEADLIELRKGAVASSKCDIRVCAVDAALGVQNPKPRRRPSKSKGRATRKSKRGAVKRRSDRPKSTSKRRSTNAATIRNPKRNRVAKRQRKQ